MPVAGFHKGDRVMTPSGRAATITQVTYFGAEFVKVTYDDSSREPKWFRAAAVRPISKHGF